MADRTWFFGLYSDRLKKNFGGLRQWSNYKLNHSFSKKVIYDSFKKEKKPVFIHIKNEVKNYYYLEKYIQYTNRKKHQFDKKWHFLNINYKNDLVIIKKNVQPSYKLQIPLFVTQVTFTYILSYVYNMFHYI